MMGNPLHNVQTRVSIAVLAKVVFGYSGPLTRRSHTSRQRCWHVASHAS